MKEQTWILGEGLVTRTLPQDPEMPFGLCNVRKSTAWVCILALPFTGHVILANSNSPRLGFSIICDIYAINFMRLLWELNNIINVFSIVPGTQWLAEVHCIIIFNHLLWPIIHFMSEIVADISVCGLVSLPRSDAWDTFPVIAFCQTARWILSLAM